MLAFVILSESQVHSQVHRTWYLANQILLGFHIQDVDLSPLVTSSFIPYWPPTTQWASFDPGCH